ncbi:MAG: hypothetical protein IJI58_01880 [Bacilli bacterium]|nr:hypothetical protein [Bacilli bacterium]
MKVRNYEKKYLIILLMVLLLFSEILIVITLSIIKVEEYSKITGVVIKDNLVLIVVDKNERKTIYSNKILFFNNKKSKYQIIEDRGIVMTKNKKDYYQLVLKFSFKNKKVNDVLEMVFIKGRIHLINIFKIIWEGG